MLPHPPFSTVLQFRFRGIPSVIILLVAVISRVTIAASLLPPSSSEVVAVSSTTNTNAHPDWLKTANDALVFDRQQPVVTSNEIEGVLKFLERAQFATNNGGNGYLYGYEHNAADAAAVMFELTGRREFLDYLVRYAEIARKGRNDPVHGMVVTSGKRNLVWPHFMKIRSNGDQREVMVELSEGLIDFIPRCARLILEHPATWNYTDAQGKSYKELAGIFVKESIRSLDDYALPYFLDPKTFLFRYPEENATHFLDAPQLAGRTPPWNRQWFLCSGILEVSRCLKLLGSDEERRAYYDRIITSTIRHFLATVKTVSAQGQPCFIWQYIVGNDKNGRPGMPEDINHGAFDLLFLSDVYLAGGYGLDDSHMMKFANTIWLLMRKDDNQFSFRVDGTGKMEPFTSANYLFFARWQPGIYTALADTVSKRKNINPGKIARMLVYKQWLQSKLQSTQKVSEPSVKQ